MGRASGTEGAHAPQDWRAAAVERAVELSDQKYCTVISTLRHTPAISSEWRIENTDA